MYGKQNPTGCPYCAKQKVCQHFNLLTKSAFLCTKWDYEINLLGPENYTLSSGSIVHWICSTDKSHKWSA
jgi:hypothetical protein